MSDLFRAPRSAARTGLAFGVISTSLLVGASAMPAGADDPMRRQLVYLESVSANATPGSPAQFRAHEEATSLREQLRSIGCD